MLHKGNNLKLGELDQRFIAHFMANVTMPETQTRITC